VCQGRDGVVLVRFVVPGLVVAGYPARPSRVRGILEGA